MANIFRKSLIVAGVLGIVAALCLTAYNLYQDDQAAGESALILQELEAIHSEPISAPTTKPDIPDYMENPYKEMPVTNVDHVDYIGVLDIPSLDLSLPIISQWNNDLLKLAPCRYQGSVYLGNLILAGHNYKAHFGRLKELEPGDSVYFTDEDSNTFSYKVSEIEKLPGTAIAEMASGDWDLTLFTCTIGGESRITVRCIQE